MKLLLAALVLSSATAPAFAMVGTAPAFTTGDGAAILFPMDGEFGRRSGLCLKAGARFVAREGSTCGGV